MAPSARRTTLAFEVDRIRSDQAAYYTVTTSENCICQLSGSIKFEV